MLELIFKGLLQWLFDMIINITEYLANSLLEIFTMDLAYFESTIPITSDIVQIMIGTGWALLLGNLVFQAMKSMASGLGFDGEDPRTLFTRTFVMTFLLVFSREVCNIGLGITNTVIGMLQVPDVVQVPQLAETTFSVPGDASWLLVIIIGIILIVQIVKLFFEIGERYVIVAILTILSPLAFSMGGSKNTADIFKGWVRMFASMCLMMVLSLIFLKMILSAMSIVPSGAAVIPWTVFIVAIARVGRKIDGLIARVGLNPAITGDPLGHSRIPGMLSFMVVKNMAKSIQAASAAEAASGKGKPVRSNKNKDVPGGADKDKGIPSEAGKGKPSPGAGSDADAKQSSRKPHRPPIGSSGEAGAGRADSLSSKRHNASEHGKPKDRSGPGASSKPKEPGHSSKPNGTEDRPGTYAGKGKSRGADHRSGDGRKEKPHGEGASFSRRLGETDKGHDASAKRTRPASDSISRHPQNSDAGMKEKRPTRPGMEAGKADMRPIEPMKPIAGTADKPAKKVPGREDALKKAGMEKLTKPTEKLPTGAIKPKTPEASSKKHPASKETPVAPRPSAGSTDKVSRGTTHRATHAHSSTASTGTTANDRPTAPGNIKSNPPAVKSMSGKPPVVKNANLQKPRNPSVTSDTRPESQKKSQVQENQSDLLTNQKSDTAQASRSNIQGRNKTTRPDTAPNTSSTKASGTSNPAALEQSQPNATKANQKHNTAQASRGNAQGQKVGRPDTNLSSPNTSSTKASRTSNPSASERSQPNVTKTNQKHNTAQASRGNAQSQNAGRPDINLSAPNTSSAKASGTSNATASERSQPNVTKANQKHNTAQASRGNAQGQKAGRPDTNPAAKSNIKINTSAAPVKPQTNQTKKDAIKSVAGQGIQRTTTQQDNGPNNNRPKNSSNETNSKPKSNPMNQEVRKQAAAVKKLDIQKNSIPSDKKQRPPTDHKGGSDK